MRWFALPIVILAALTPACASSGAVGVGTVKDVVPPPKVMPNTVVRIDPKTLKPVQVVPVGDDPDLVVDAGGYIWVTHHMLSDQNGPAHIYTGDRTLTRVDPATGKAKQVGGGLSPCGLSAGPPGSVLVANCFPRSSGQTPAIVRVDAKTLALKSWTVPGGHRFFRGVGYGGGWVWTDGVANHGRSVIRINPRTGAQRSIDVRYPPGAFAWDERHGDLWINNSGGLVGAYPAGLTRLDAKNGASSFFPIYNVACHPVFPAVAGDTVWAADWYSAQVLRVAITGSRMPQNIPLPTTNDSAGVWNVAAGAGYIWATTPRDGTLWRINPHTYHVTRIAMPYFPTMVTADASGVWVTVRGESRCPGRRHREALRNENWRTGHDSHAAAVTGCGCRSGEEPGPTGRRPDRPRRRWCGCRGGDGARLRAVARGVRRAGHRGRPSAQRRPEGSGGVGRLRRERTAHGSRPGSGLSRSTGSAGGQRSIWLRFCWAGSCHPLRLPDDHRGEHGAGPDPGQRSRPGSGWSRTPGRAAPGAGRSTPIIRRPHSPAASAPGRLRCPPC